MQLDDPINEWAKVRTELRDARKTAMKRLGYTEAGLKDLESKAIQIMRAQDNEFIRTEFGDVQLVQTCIYLKKEGGIIGYNHKLHLVK